MMLKIMIVWVFSFVLGSGAVAHASPSSLTQNQDPISGIFDSRRADVARRTREVAKSNFKDLGIPDLDPTRDLTDDELFYSPLCLEASVALALVLRESGLSPKLVVTSMHAYLYLEGKIIDLTYRQHFRRSIEATHPEKQERKRAYEALPELLVSEPALLQSKLLSFGYSSNWQMGDGTELEDWYFRTGDAELENMAAAMGAKWLPTEVILRGSEIDNSIPH